MCVYGCLAEEHWKVSLEWLLCFQHLGVCVCVCKRMCVGPAGYVSLFHCAEPTHSDATLQNKSVSLFRMCSFTLFLTLPLDFLSLWVKIIRLWEQIMWVLHLEGEIFAVDQCAKLSTWMSWSGWISTLTWGLVAACQARALFFSHTSPAPWISHRTGQMLYSAVYFLSLCISQK